MEYLSYMYYCGSTLCGPNFEFKDFVNFMELKENYSKIPTTISATAIRMSHGFACLVLHLILSEFVDIDYIITEDFAAQAFWYKLAYSYFLIKKIIFRYLFAFCMMDAAVISSGLAYNGKSESGKENFNRI